MKRAIRKGIVPPPCDQITRRSGKRCEAPVNTMLAIAREVSVPYSISESLISGMRWPQHGATVGWVLTNF
jgi:hypothetical protein